MGLLAEPNDSKSIPSWHPAPMELRNACQIASKICRKVIHHFLTKCFIRFEFFFLFLLYVLFISLSIKTLHLFRSETFSNLNQHNLLLLSIMFRQIRYLIMLKRCLISSQFYYHWLKIYIPYLIEIVFGFCYKLNNLFFWWHHYSK